jgi:N-acylneuraminate cytidylyltransferase
MSKEITEIDECFVSTDDPEIAEVASRFGAVVIMRPPELATDDAPEWLAWQHAVKWVRQNYGEFDRFLSLPATAPLRSISDVKNALMALVGKFDMVLSFTNSSRSPWFNMVRFDEENILSLVVGGGQYSRRQEVPLTYDLTTVAYVTSPDFVLTKRNIWDGNVTGIFVPKERAIDIDDELDFFFAEMLAKKNMN